MRWFGKSWKAIICIEGEHAETPVGKQCFYCTKLIKKEDRGFLLPYSGVDRWTEVPFHFECLMKNLGLRDE